MFGPSILDAVINADTREDLNLRQSEAEFGNMVGVSLDDSATRQSDSPIYDELMNENSAISRTLINFEYTIVNLSRNEFEILFGFVEQALYNKWYTGRGLKSKITHKDGFFLAIFAMKANWTWTELANRFRISVVTIQRIINNAIEISAPILYDKFVKLPTMAQNVETNRLIFFNSVFSKIILTRFTQLMSNFSRHTGLPEILRSKKCSFLLSINFMDSRSKSVCLPGA
jgi:hypothetical protein